MNLTDLPDKVAESIKRARDAADSVELPALPPAPTIWDPAFATTASMCEALEKSGDVRIARSDLLTLGNQLSAQSSDAALRAYLYNVNAWGYGSSGYGAARTKRVADSAQFCDSARVVLGRLRESPEDGAVLAYFDLLNDQHHVRGWGPAFFTKFLAFAGNGPDLDNAPPTSEAPQILDRWMARAIDNLVPPIAVKGIRGFARTSRWTTPQYAYYVRVVARWANRTQLTPMKVERVLFHHHRDRRERSQQKERTEG